MLLLMKINFVLYRRIKRITEWWTWMKLLAHSWRDPSKDIDRYSLGGRGHWTVNCTSTQSLIETVSNWVTKKLKTKDKSSCVSIKLFYSAYKKNVIMAYHKFIKIYTDLSLVTRSMYWPIIGNLYKL